MKHRSATTTQCTISYFYLSPVGFNSQFSLKSDFLDILRSKKRQNRVYTVKTVKTHTTKISRHNFETWISVKKWPEFRLTEEQKSLELNGIKSNLCQRSNNQLNTCHLSNLYCQQLSKSPFFAIIELSKRNVEFNCCEKNQRWFWIILLPDLSENP